MPSFGQLALKPSNFLMQGLVLLFAPYQILPQNAIFLLQPIDLDMQRHGRHVQILFLFLLLFLVSQTYSMHHHRGLAFVCFFADQIVDPDLSLQNRTYVGL
jgi:hypothetical protein